MNKPHNIDLLDTEEGKTWTLFLRAHAALMRKFESELQEANTISLTWLDALVQLSLAEDQRMTHTRLSERLLVTAGGVTRLIDRMAKAGLVIRRQSRTDRRTSHIVMTDSGRKALDEALAVQMKSVSEHFISYLQRDDPAVLTEFLRRVLGEDAAGAREL